MDGTRDWSESGTKVTYHGSKTNAHGPAKILCKITYEDGEVRYTLSAQVSDSYSVLLYNVRPESFEVTAP